ncbi:MAG: hypothetical protein ICV54_27425 [Nostoc sp. C3-bin3]|nr:hypothetical protein [Nostoc sp. C3-bin3]
MSVLVATRATQTELLRVVKKALQPWREQDNTYLVLDVDILRKKLIKIFLELLLLNMAFYL